MFDRIAHRYDFLNHFLSAGQDIRWRNKVIQFIPARSDITVLDLATGTADLLITVLRKNKHIKHGIGIDMAEKMLEIGRHKINNFGLSEKIELHPGNIMDIKYPDNSFDIVTIAFGIRNVEDVQKGLKEIYRVLKENGRLIILEFSLPKSRLINAIYLFYFRKILPCFGSVISGDFYAYQYLNKTVETFPYGSAFCDLMDSSGFKNTGFKPLSFGIASIYTADK